MLQSMTGFATHTFELPIDGQMVSVTVHLKSLNGRFFEATCRLPHALTHLEAPLIKRLKDHLIRGTVHCLFYLGAPLTVSSKPAPSYSIIEGYLEAARSIEERFGRKYSLNQDVSLTTLLTLPNAIEFAEGQIAQEVVDLLFIQIDKLSQTLIEARIQEGKELENDLTSRLTNIAAALEEIKIRTKSVLEIKKAKLIANLNELLAHTSAENKDHHIQMIYNQLERLDINEEIVRLDSHIKSTSACLQDDRLEKGKRLDFILQEMFREINTIGAKCADSELSARAITIKVELEKLREQVQNIV
ncbi:MAG: TIGR00255 family protein [candidate division TM6 bacterium GW2011_GWE2_42_60]|nr:MAG: TIGR00255 family protein [candidate division TM6 bacterium GW2011_GWE2_42_60]HBY06236.1 YicC family protein [Candidatus Dependentiae bacterium]